MSEILAQEVKAFPIRVAIVEPGGIKTPVFDKLRRGPADTHYPQARRMLALYAASLQHPVAPAVVGEQIRQIIESERWQLRYPVGPDAVPLLRWRAGMSDAEWADFWAMQDDEAWCAHCPRLWVRRPAVSRMRAQTVRHPRWLTSHWSRRPIASDPASLQPWGAAHRGRWASFSMPRGRGVFRHTTIRRECAWSSNPKRQPWKS